MFQAYVEAKQRNNCLDYDDLLLYVAQAMSVPELAEEVGSRFDHILVDEYQDTNRLQASILLALKPHGEGLTVVGDDAQSIYAFRAAEVRNILDFPKHFNPPAEVVTLSRNYRSTQPIFKAANAVIALAKERFTKDLWSDRLSGQKPLIVTVRDEIDEAAYVAGRILENREAGMRLKDQAVLFRASHHSGPLELELTRRNIPFVKFGGLKFLDAAHIKDVLAVLRWTSNPRNRVAGFRVLQLLPGIGPANANRIIQQLGPELVHLRRVTEIEPPAASAPLWPEFSSLISQVAIDCIGWPAELARIRKWYEPLLEQHWDDAPARLADLMQLEQIAGGYQSREQFLTELTLDPPDATSGQADTPLLDEDYLILSTMHSAKGPGMAQRFRAEGGRRLHSIGSRRRQPCGARGRAPTALRRHDPSEGRTGADHPAALLCPSAGRRRRPARLWQPDAVHSLKHPECVRGALLVTCMRRVEGRDDHWPENRSRRQDARDVAVIVRRYAYAFETRIRFVAPQPYVKPSPLPFPGRHKTFPRTKTVWSLSTDTLRA